jgi:hypothetical protein
MIGWELFRGGAEVLDLLPDNGRVSGREDAGQGPEPDRVLGVWGRFRVCR